MVARGVAALDMITQALACIDEATQSACRHEYDSALDDLLAARLLLATVLQTLEE